MKRVRDFIVVPGVGDIGTRLRKTPKASRNRLASWHDIRKQCRALLSEEEPTSMVIFDAATRQIVACFSTEDEQLKQRSNQTEDGEVIHVLPKWESSSLGQVNGQSYVLNCNSTDFEWHLLEGGKYESPFRLSYLERVAERNPEGFIARWARSIHEWRDMLSPGRVA